METLVMAVVVWVVWSYAGTFMYLLTRWDYELGIKRGIFGLVTLTVRVYHKYLESRTKRFGGTDPNRTGYIHAFSRPFVSILVFASGILNSILFATWFVLKLSEVIVRRIITIRPSYIKSAVAGLAIMDSASDVKSEFKSREASLLKTIEEQNKRINALEKDLRKFAGAWAEVKGVYDIGLKTMTGQKNGAVKTLNKGIQYQNKNSGGKWNNNGYVNINDLDPDDIGDMLH